jgi:alcohol dehydrogenase, propanol-preferring
VVVGVGGLGHMAVQILKALTPARILAIDEAYARLREGSLNGRAVVCPNGADRRRQQRASLGGTRTNEKEEVRWLDSK